MSLCNRVRGCVNRVGALRACERGAVGYRRRFCAFSNPESYLSLEILRLRHQVIDHGSQIALVFGRHPALTLVTSTLTTHPFNIS